VGAQRRFFLLGRLASAQSGYGGAVGCWKHQHSQPGRRQSHSGERISHMSCTSSLDGNDPPADRLSNEGGNWQTFSNRALAWFDKIICRDKGGARL